MNPQEVIQRNERTIRYTNRVLLPDLSEHGFRPDRFNLCYVTPCGAIVDYNEALRIIQLNHDTHLAKLAAQQPFQPPRAVKLRNSFDALRQSLKNQPTNDNDSTTNQCTTLSTPMEHS